MAYSSWSVVTGEIPSAAKWNILGTNDAHFNDKFAKQAYAFRAYNSITTSLTDGTPVQILLQTEEYDYNNNFASSAYTAPVAGVYSFVGQFVIDSTVVTGVTAYAELRKNGSLVQYGPRYVPISNGTYNVVAQLLLAASDVITLWGTQDSAGVETTLTGSSATFLAGHLVYSLT